MVAGVLLFKYYCGYQSDLKTAITIKYRFNLSNSTSRPIKNASLLAGTPMDATSTQKCLQRQANHPSKVVKDDAGNTYLQLDWEVIPPYTTKIVDVVSELEVSEKPQKSHAKPNAVYLSSEPYIESDDILVKETAGRLKAKTTRQTAANIYNWVAENIRYAGYVKNNRGARYALRYRKGDCTEFAALFVALCRAGGLPARLMGGFVTSKSSVLTIGDYHNWAEFYDEGVWRIADPQRRVFMDDPETSSYIALQIIQPSDGADGTLVSKIKGNGLKVKSGI
jgi:transglutaminase-like putative cysteine protease